METPQKCPKCGSDIKEIPAGISKKTGRSYKRFLACSNPHCSWTQNLGYEGMPTGTGMPREKTIQTDGNSVDEKLDDISNKLFKIWDQIIKINNKLE